MKINKYINKEKKEQQSNPWGLCCVYHLDLNRGFAEFSLTEGINLATFIAQGEGEMHGTHTVYTQCDATAILDTLIWIGGSERLHHSCLPSCPCHQFSLHGYSPE